MSQYSTGTVTTNGTTTVTGSGTSWSGNVEAGQAFFIPQTAGGDGLPYVISNVVSDTEITLTGAYAGSDVSGAKYRISTEYTPNYDIIELSANDVPTPGIFTRAVRRVDTVVHQLSEGVITANFSSAADITLTESQALNHTIEITGSSAGDVIVPLNEGRQYKIDNQSSLDRTILVSGQTGVEVPAGNVADVRCGASDIEWATDYAGELFNRTELTKAIGNINSPMTWLPLKGPNDAIQLQGDYQHTRTQATNGIEAATETDRYGVVHKLAWYNDQTISATGSNSLTDTGQSFTRGDLVDHVIKLTDSVNGYEAYRWIRANGTTQVFWDEPIDFTPDGYEISKPRFEEEGLLIEGSSTNLLTYSEQFDNAAWAKTNVTVSADTYTAPDGTVTADKIVPDNAAAILAGLLRAESVTSGETYTLSVFANNAGFDHIKLQLPTSYFGTGDDRQTVFDLANGTIVSGEGKIEEIYSSGSNKYYRCSISSTAISTGSASVQIYVTDAAGGSIDGDGVSGVSLWGAQLEELPFASSYIPTTSAAVTLAAQPQKIKVDGNIVGSDASKGIFLDFDVATLDQQQRIIQVDTTAGSLYIEISSAGDLIFYHGTASNTIESKANLSASTVYRVGIVFDDTNAIGYLDGVQKVSNATPGSVTIDTEGSIWIGSTDTPDTYAYGHISNLRQYGFAPSSAIARIM